MAVAIRPKEITNRGLACDVETQGGLIEKQDIRLVQQRSGQLTSHALTKRQLPDGLVHHRRKREQRHELIASGAIVGWRDRIDRAIELEHLFCRQVPLELLLVPQDQRDPAFERQPPAHGSLPATTARPVVGTSRPVSILSVVVLPAPLGPRNATISPGAIANDTSATARTSR